MISGSPPVPSSMAIGNPGAGLGSISMENFAVGVKMNRT